eukprot:gene19947-23865_t
MSGQEEPVLAPDELNPFKKAFVRPPNVAFLQHEYIPFYDIRSADDLSKNGLKEEVYDMFFGSGPGCIGLKNVFTEDVMEKYNKWCEDHLENAKNKANCTHPKQKDKFLINDVMEQMSVEDPDLLMKLINNPVYNAVMDTLLGMSTIGAFTAHWIQPGGDRQMSHVDYPLHVGSGKFWESSKEKLMDLTTEYQMNHILPFYSVQAIMASDAMDHRNGSTEVVPFSSKVHNIDAKILDKEFYDSVENLFHNVSLEKGDVFLFNRRLCHRGGRNSSDKRRNSAIMQCVWLWGIGQSGYSGREIIHNLENSKLYTSMTVEEKKRFELRLVKPFPIDTTKHN